jgi:hypothetical protein
MNALEDAYERIRKSKLLRKEPEVDEGKLQEQRERGHRAERLLADDMLIEAWDAVENYYLTAWRGSDAHDIELRERAWTALQILTDVKGALARVARDGAVASEALVRINHR